jgi:hypothetical protein
MPFDGVFFKGRFLIISLEVGAMRRRYVIILLVVLLILFLLVFRNIVYTFISSSERIDGYMLSVMVQGAISPSKEFALDGNGGAITIVLPKGAGEIGRNTFLIPISEYREYLMSLDEMDGYAVENLGYTVDYLESSVAVEVEGEIRFHISVAPYTGAYMKLTYSR